MFVNPALTEPFGLTLIEAAASGLPFVATEDGGPRDIVANCKSGVLVDPLDSQALAEALSDFDGAIVMVSHDRHLIGLVCDTYWRVADGVVEPFDGDLDQYAAWLRTRPAAQGTKAKMAEAAPTPPPPTKPLPGRKPPNPHKLAQAEANIAALEQQLTDLDAALADPASYQDSARAALLTREREETQAKLEQAEQAWGALYE